MVRRTRARQPKDGVRMEEVSETRGAAAEPAVQVIGAVKSYGSGKNVIPVLRKLNMVVPKANIYGLLGPSGCGKTTLLRCILGRLHLDKGHITTLGRTPGTRGHQVPGRDVGYMPQDLALFMEFTIGETLRFFGHLFRMNSSDISDRTAFLIQLLNLPERSRLIKRLSGGQQRRTSFAIALLQQPPLMILDEPTVGVDPLLRQRIWEHLLEIAEYGNTTIIITTHYIEEARQASMVGLMRNGRILAESNPEVLVEKHDERNLEDVFLKLCEEDVDSEDEVENIPAIKNKNINCGSEDEEEALLGTTLGDYTSTSSAQPSAPLPTSTVPKEADVHLSICDFMPSPRNICAMVLKNLLILRRNIGLLLFQFFIPSFQIILFCVCIGQAPHHLKMAVINNETALELPAALLGPDVLTTPAVFSTPAVFVNNETVFTTPAAPDKPSVPKLGEVFLAHIKNTTIVQERYTSQHDAISSVKSGKTWGVIGLGADYTKDLLMRFTSSKKLNNETISGGSIHLYLDTTNQQIFYTIQSEILRAFTEFATETLETYHKELKVNPAEAKVPIILEPPIYGTLDPIFVHFMAPGIILSITFFMATGLTSLSFVLDRKQGLLDRSLVAGVTAVEVMIAHVLTQLLVMIVQVGLLLVFTLAVFKVPYEGPLILVILLTLFQGFTGMALGLLISALCTEETSAIQCALGTVYPNMILSGVIWPVEGMPVWMRYVAKSLPTTYAAEAMRSILARGWGLTSPGVWEGFVMSIGWGWTMMAVAAIIFKIKG